MGSVPHSPARSRGLGEVAHDLRSGLAATQAYLDLARERLAEGTPVDAGDLDRLDRAVARIAATLAELEALARAPAAPRTPEGPR